MTKAPVASPGLMKFVSVVSTVLLGLAIKSAWGIPQQMADMNVKIERIDVTVEVLKKLVMQSPGVGARNMVEPCHGCLCLRRTSDTMLVSQRK